jgi:putative tryptophan/tyrosine transport system substrate-binding protein
VRRREVIGLIGSASCWPLVARAQQRGRARRIVIAHLSGEDAAASETGSPTWRAFFAELRRLGYAEGENLVVERFAAEGGYWAHLPQRLSDLVARRPDVIVVDSSSWARRINALNGTVPIVALATNPLEEGVASSLASPGGSITGIATDTGPALLGKQLDLLLEAAPNRRHVACLGADWPYAGMRTLWSDAQRRGVTVQEFSVHVQFRHGSRASHYVDAFPAMLRDGADAVLVLDDPEHLVHAATIAELGLRHRLPIVSPFRRLTEAGGVMSYGPDWFELERRRAVYVARILDGAKPQDLPIEQPSIFELIFNLNTVKALGLSMPPTLLARADEVIE